MAKEREEYCGNCAAYISTDAEGGECHKGHPVAQMDGAMRNIREVQTCWPYVESIDWCFGWVKSENGQEEE